LATSPGRAKSRATFSFDRATLAWAAVSVDATGRRGASAVRDGVIASVEAIAAGGVFCSAAEADKASARLARFAAGTGCLLVDCGVAVTLGSSLSDLAAAAANDLMARLAISPGCVISPASATMDCGTTLDPRGSEVAGADDCGADDCGADVAGVGSCWGACTFILFAAAASDSMALLATCPGRAVFVLRDEVAPSCSGAKAVRVGDAVAVRFRGRSAAVCEVAGADAFWALASRCVSGRALSTACADTPAELTLVASDVSASRNCREKLEATGGGVFGARSCTGSAAFFVGIVAAGRRGMRRDETRFDMRLAVEGVSAPGTWETHRQPTSTARQSTRENIQTSMLEAS
jgi:hypothetical protein